MNHDKESDKLWSSCMGDRLCTQTGFPSWSQQTHYIWADDDRLSLSSCACQCLLDSKSCRDGRALEKLTTCQSLRQQTDQPSSHHHSNWEVAACSQGSPLGEGILPVRVNAWRSLISARKCAELLLSLNLWIIITILWRFLEEVAQMVKNPPAVWETWVWSLGWEDPLEEGMQPTPVFLPGESLWTKEPVWLQFMGSQRVRHD